MMDMDDDTEKEISLKVLMEIMKEMAKRDALGVKKKPVDVGAMLGKDGEEPAEGSDAEEAAESPEVEASEGSEDDEDEDKDRLAARLMSSRR
jgi:hypothetical protein